MLCGGSLEVLCFTAAIIFQQDLRPDEQAQAQGSSPPTRKLLMPAARAWYAQLAAKGT